MRCCWTWRCAIWWKTRCKHTPAGTAVEVQLDPAGSLAARWWTTALWSRRHHASEGTRRTLAPRNEWGLGLGLGHRVVAKIAAIHNARFSHAVLAAPQAGWAAYRLVFDVDAAPAAA